MISRLLLVLLVTVLWTPFVQGRPSTEDSPEPVRLTDIDVPDAPTAGTVGYFRARISPETTRPVNYFWDLGDGTLSIGTLVSHAYAAAGTYTLTVVARNEAGGDTLQASVTVDVPPPDASASPPVAAEASSPEATPDASSTSDTASRPPRVTVPRSAIFGPGGVAVDTGGHTWVVQSDLWSERAHDRMLVYRLHGFRADVYVDTSGRGSPARRIVIGQFKSRAEARVARRWLPADATSPWLLTLDGAPVFSDRTD